MPRMLLLMNPHLQIFDFSLPSYHLTPDRGHKKNIIISWLMYGFGKKDFYSDFMNNTHVTLEARQTYNKLMDFAELDECFYVEGYTYPEPSPGNEDVWNSIKKLVLDPYFAPGMAENLQGIPKTFIVTLENSPVRDEAVIFHWRMETYVDPSTIFRHPIYDDVKYGDVFNHTVFAYMSDATRFVLCNEICLWSLQWRHNGRDGVSNHQPHDCLLNCLFRRRSKIKSKLRVTDLCAGNSPVTSEFPAQKASNA